MNVKIGCSVPFDAFFAEPSSSTERFLKRFGGLDDMLKTLAGQAFSVELRTVSSEDDPGIVCRAVERCKAFGLVVTIHGGLKENMTPENFFAPYTELFSAGLQSLYNITVHPLAREEDTERVLRGICVYADEKDYPVRVALENQRLRDEATRQGICGKVSGIVRRIAYKRLGICFDYGHQLSNERNFGSDSDPVEADFIPQVCHTHIHSLYEGRTHFPLTVGETALERNMTAMLEAGYEGVWNLELSLPRFEEKMDGKDAFLQSIAVLKAAAIQVSKKIELRGRDPAENYRQQLTTLRNRLDSREDGIAVIGPAAYAIRMGAIKIAVDPCACLFSEREEKRAVLREFLQDFDVVINTHEHADHYDRELLESLPASCAVYIPDFTSKPAKNASLTHAGQQISLGEIDLSIFESKHSVPGNLVPEYGLALRWKGEHYVFPGDVRDYSLDGVPVFPKTKFLVAHLWLGKVDALFLNDNPYVAEFCQFVRHFEAEKGVLCHLCDTSRSIETMWSSIHCDLVREELPNFRPAYFGEWLPL